MLASATGMHSFAVARQVHGTHIVEAATSSGGESGVVGEADGFVTAAKGVLLAVTAADCVPVFIVDLEGRCIALLHAGWRGAAGGILEVGLSMLKARFGVEPANVSMYLGPSICGSCYEVGVEVLRAFRPDAAGPAQLDLRTELAQKAVRAGVSAQRVVRSQWCTRCGPVHLHSHRALGVKAGRMAAFLGLVPETPRAPGPRPRGRELR
jgi:YfiH family protein